MITKEEVKINLMRFFGNRENEVAIKFLNSYAKPLKVYSLDFESPLGKLKENNGKVDIKPFHIEEYEMIMNLSVVKDSDGTIYHEISFTSDKKYDNEYSCELYPRMYIQKSQETELRVINEKIVLQNLKQDFLIHSDYAIVAMPYRVTLGVEVDIVSNQLTLIGEEANQLNSYESFITKFKSDEAYKLEESSLYSDVFIEEVNEVSKKNQNFKRSYAKYNLKEILKLKTAEMLIAFNYLVKMPEVNLVFKNPKITKHLLYEVGRRISMKEDGHSAEPSVILKVAKSINEMLGFNQSYEELIPCLEKISFEYILKTRDALELVNKVLPIVDGQAALKFYNLLVSRNYHMMSEFLYFGQRGYSFNELYAYILTAERKQAILKNSALTLLYEVCTLYELKTGTFKKFFPKSLRLMLDVFSRDVNALHESNKAKFNQNMIARRKDIFIKNDEFEILPITESDQNHFNHHINSMRGDDVVLYRRKKSSNDVEVRIFKNEIRSISDKLSDVHLNNIMNWAKQNNLYIHSLNVYKSR